MIKDAIIQMLLSAFRRFDGVLRATAPVPSVSVPGQAGRCTGSGDDTRYRAREASALSGPDETTYVCPIPAALRGRTAARSYSAGVVTTTDGVTGTAGGVVTSTGGVVTSTGGVVTSTGGVVTSTGGVVTSTGGVVTSTGMVIAFC